MYSVSSARVSAFDRARLDVIAATAEEALGRRRDDVHAGEADQRSERSGAFRAQARVERERVAVRRPPQPQVIQESLVMVGAPRNVNVPRSGTWAPGGQEKAST